MHMSSLHKTTHNTTKMIEDDTNTSFSTEDSVDEVVKTTQVKKRKKPQKSTLKKVSKDTFKTRANTSQKTVITELNKNNKKSKDKQTGSIVKDTKRVGRNTKKIIGSKQTTNSPPITVFTKTILEALYDLNKSQKWVTN